MNLEQVRRAAEAAHQSEHWRSAFESARQWLVQVTLEDFAARFPMLIVLGDSACDLPSPESEEIEFAIATLTEGLAEAPSEASGDRGALCLILGRLYEARAEGDDRQNNERAVQFLRNSLSGYPRDRDPAIWASIHSKIGMQYAERVGVLATPSFSAMHADLMSARHEFEQALSVFIESDFPEERAETRELLSWCLSSISSLNRRSYPPDPTKKLPDIKHGVGWRRR